MKDSRDIVNSSYPLIMGIIFVVVWLVMSYFSEPDTFFQPDTFLLAIVGGIAVSGIGFAFLKFMKYEE